MQYNGIYFVLGPDPISAVQTGSWSAAASADNGSSWTVSEVADLELPPLFGLDSALDIDYRSLWPW